MKGQWWQLLLLILLLGCSDVVSCLSSAASRKRILVTGANKGIGKAVCERLLSEWDDTHVLLGSRNLERGNQAVSDIRQALGEEVVQDRLECVELDTSSDDSVQAVASKLNEGPALYGIINNAGVRMEKKDAAGNVVVPEVGFGFVLEETLNVNYFGPRRVNDVLGPLVQRPGGRIVNVASAGGPRFVEGLAADDPLRAKLTKPWTIQGGVEELDRLARSVEGVENCYQCSKAFLNAYTVLHAKQSYPDLIINSCTPGWILTDLTDGRGASDPPSKGAVPPCFLLMDESFATRPPGRYYGSDCLRSPLDVYRGPGDPEYENDEDLVEQ